jgi:hypothetical protein
MVMDLVKKTTCIATAKEGKWAWQRGFWFWVAFAFFTAQEVARAKSIFMHTAEVAWIWLFGGDSEPSNIVFNKSCFHCAEIKSAPVSSSADFVSTLNTPPCSWVHGKIFFHLYCNVANTIYWISKFLLELSRPHAKQKNKTNG